MQVEAPEYEVCGIWDETKHILAIIYTDDEEHEEGWVPLICWKHGQVWGGACHQVSEYFLPTLLSLSCATLLPPITPGQPMFT